LLRRLGSLGEDELLAASLNGSLYTSKTEVARVANKKQVLGARISPTTESPLLVEIHAEQA